MSLAQLVQVKLPSEIGAQTLLDLKPTAQPVEDFMAVLDRALADRPPSENNQETLFQKNLEAERSYHAADKTRYRSQDNPATDTSAKQPAEPNLVAQRSESSASPWMEKSRNREVSLDKAKTLQKDGTKPLPKAKAEKHLDVVPESTGQAALKTGQIGAKLASPQVPILGGHPVVANADKHQTQHHATNKVSTKSHTKTPLENAVLKNTKPTTKISTSGQDPAQNAAVKMQLHADTGGTKGLQDAMAMVKNLAHDLGLDKTKTDGATLAGPKLNFNQATIISAPKVTGGQVKHEPVSEKLSRVDVLRNERLGKKGPESSLRTAADQGRVQVLDVRSAPHTSLVLESMISQAQLKSGSKGDESGLRRDGFQLLSSAYIPAAERNTVSLPMYLNGTQAGNLHQALRSHLNAQGNSEIVQQARIVMNGKESGDIKLILKPENLGEVRIHLQMQDGHIAGKIFVENKEVQAAFEDNMTSLMQAFQDGGLSMGAMDVAVSDPNARGKGFSQQEQQPDERQKLYAVGRLENSVATVSAANHDYSQINLVV